MTTTEPEQWQRPSPRLRAVRRTEVGALTLIVLIAALAVTIASGSGVAIVISVAVVAVFGVIALTLSLRRVSAWGYVERADDLIVVRGLMFRRLSVVPYGRMQFVDVSAGPFERIFGLATVRLHTAAAATDARIPGLAGDDARRLRDALAARGEAKSMGL